MLIRFAEISQKTNTVEDCLPSNCKLMFCTSLALLFALSKILWISIKNSRQRDFLSFFKPKHAWFCSFKRQDIDILHIIQQPNMLCLCAKQVVEGIIKCVATHDYLLIQSRYNATERLLAKVPTWFSGNLWIICVKILQWFFHDFMLYLLIKFFHPQLRPDFNSMIFSHD